MKSFRPVSTVQTALLLILLFSQSQFMLTFPVSGSTNTADHCITKEFFRHLVLKNEQKLEAYVSEDKLQHEDPLCSPRQYAPSAISVPFQIMPVYTQKA